MNPGKFQTCMPGN